MLDAEVVLFFLEDFVRSIKVICLEILDFVDLVVGLADGLGFGFLVTLLAFFVVFGWVFFKGATLGLDVVFEEAVLALDLDFCALNGSRFFKLLIAM